MLTFCSQSRKCFVFNLAAKVGSNDAFLNDGAGWVMDMVVLDHDWNDAGMCSISCLSMPVAI